MADINNIESIQDLKDCIAEYLKTPRSPAITGAQLNILLSKTIDLVPGGTQTAAEIRDLLVTLTGADRLPASAIKDLPSGGSMTAGEIKAALETLTGTGRLDASAIKNLPSGGGSLPELIANQILYANASGDLEQDTNLEFDSASKSLYVGNITEEPVREDDQGYIFGDSIAGGVGSIGGQSFGAIICSLLGITANIDGVSASTLEKREPINITGGTNMVDRIDNIPTKTSTDRILIFEFGINDFYYNGENYTPENFKEDYITIINACLSKGWPSTDIVIMSTAYCSPGIYGTAGTGGTPAVSEERHLAFNQATLEVSQELNTLYFDVFNYLKDRGGILLLNDGLHPNQNGHRMMALGLLDLLTTKIYKNGQSFGVNGISEFFKIIYKTRYIIADGGLQGLLGIDSNGFVGLANSLPDNTRILGDLRVKNKIIQEGIVGGSEGDNDILLLEGTEIRGYFNNEAWFNSIELADSGVNLNVRLRYNNGKFRVFALDGETFVFEIRPNGEVVAGDKFVVPYPTGKLSSDFNPDLYYFEPFGEGTGTNIRNSWGVGSFNIFLSGGVSGGKERMFGINAKGQILIKKDSATSGFEQPENCARLQVDSTTEGILIPRMSSIQRNEMGFITGVRTSGPSSGYTSATAEVVGGGGTGAEVEVTVGEGGSITFSITNPGTGYVTSPTLEVTGDGIPPSIIIIDINLVPGVQIYNTTTNKLNIYDGASWKQPVVEEAD